MGRVRRGGPVLAPSPPSRHQTVARPRSPPNDGPLTNGLNPDAANRAIGPSASWRPLIIIDEQAGDLIAIDQARHLLQIGRTVDTDSRPDRQ